MGRTAGTVAPVNFPPCPWAGYLLGQANIFTKIKTKNATFHLRQQISGGSAQAKARMRPTDLTKPWGCSHKDQVNNIRSETVTFFNTGSNGTREGLQSMDAPGRAQEVGTAQRSTFNGHFNVQVLRQERNIEPMLPKAYVAICGW